jgi:hypothetical protein
MVKLVKIVKVLILSLLFILVMSFCHPPVAPNPCQTGSEGSFVTIAFNSDINNFGPADTCDFSSAVGDVEANTYQPELETQSSRLIGLRSDSEVPFDKSNINISIESDPPTDYIIGMTYQFRGEDFILKQIRDHCYVWITPEAESKIDNDVDSDGDGVSLSLYADYFNDNSWFDITDNFYKPVNYFGWTEDTINILFQDMGESPAGYFSPADLNAGFNAIRLNVRAAINGGSTAYDEPNPLFTNGTLTHELQHLVHTHYVIDMNLPRGLEIWMNELLSSSAESVYSGQTGIYINFFNERAEHFSEVDLLDWISPNHRDRYALAALFGTWLAFQTRDGNDIGVFYRTIYDNIGSFSKDVSILVKVLDELGVYSFDDTNFNDLNSVQQAWAEVYGDFLGALVLDGDNGLLSFNGAWDYPGVNPYYPDDETPVRPEVYFSKAGVIELNTSSFAYVMTDREVIDVDDSVVYKVLDYTD